MTAHIERKIRRDFAPLLVTAREQHKWTPYRVYVGYSYLAELTMLLAGLGLATPLTSAMAAAHAGAPAGGVEGVGQLGVASVVLLVTWLCVKIYVQQESLEKRCSLLASYRKQCRSIERELEGILEKHDPMDDLLNLQSRLRDLVNRNSAEDALRDENGVDEKLAPNFDAFSRRLIEAYKENWELQPIVERRQTTGAT